MEGNEECEYPYYRKTSEVILCPNSDDGRSGYNITVEQKLKMDISYRKFDFTDERIAVDYPDGSVTRYNCVLKK